MGLLDKIKQDAQRSGQNKGKFIYFREGEKKRVRFLNDMEDGFELTFHDSFEAGINVPCQEIFGRNCQYCEEEGIRTRTQYAWSVYDYDANEVKIFMFPMNNCSPLGAIAAMYETYGTLMDRDYVISVTGKQQNKTFSVVPMDKNKFRNEKAKAYSKSAFLKILDKAFPDEHKDYSKSDEEKDLSEMTAKELYQYCEDNDIEAEPKMKKEYYLDIIEQSKNGNDNDDWDDEDDSKYSDLSPKELYKLCQERNIEAEPRKIASYYIGLLEEDDKAEDDWGDEESEEEDDDWDD